MKFTYNHRVNGHEIDINGIVDITSIMRYAQEAANLQHLTYGPTTEELRKGGKAFILSRVALDYIQPIYPHEEIEITTWLKDARGFGYSRFTEITRNGIPCVKMTAFWGAMDIASRRPIKVDEIPLNFGTDDCILEVNAPIRFKKSGSEMQKLPSHTVLYGDCDENIHLNNTNYPRIFCDRINTMLGKRVNEFSINYAAEAPLNTTFDIYCAENENEYIFKTDLGDAKTGAEARILLGDI